MRRELRRLGAAGGAALAGETGDDALRREVARRPASPWRSRRSSGSTTAPASAPITRASTAAASIGGALRASAETPAVAWFDPIALPRTLFPWYRGPLADALAELPEPSPSNEHQGWRTCSRARRSISRCVARSDREYRAVRCERYARGSRVS
jgi:hypothetical protein